jgi:hypothetical protein
MAFGMLIRHERLVLVYNGLTEGFDIADLKDASALLDELENGRS